MFQQLRRLNVADHDLERAYTFKQRHEHAGKTTLSVRIASCFLQAIEVKALIDLVFVLLVKKFKQDLFEAFSTLVPGHIITPTPDCTG